MSKLSRNKIPDHSNQFILQLSMALDEVKSAMGSRNEILLPVRLKDSESTTPAMVDLRLFFATVKMTELWTTENQRFWNILQREGADNILFPTSFCDKPLKASSLIRGLHIMETKLRSEALNHRLDQKSQVDSKTWT